MFSSWYHSPMKSIQALVFGDIVAWHKHILKRSTTHNLTIWINQCRHLHDTVFHDLFVCILFKNIIPFWLWITLKVWNQCCSNIHNRKLNTVNVLVQICCMICCTHYFLNLAFKLGKTQTSVEIAEVYATQWCVSGQHTGNPWSAIHEEWKYFKIVIVTFTFSPQNMNHTFCWPEIGWNRWNDFSSGISHCPERLIHTTDLCTPQKFLHRFVFFWTKIWKLILKIMITLEIMRTYMKQNYNQQTCTWFSYQLWKGEQNRQVH